CLWVDPRGPDRRGNGTLDPPCQALAGRTFPRRSGIRGIAALKPRYSAGRARTGERWIRLPRSGAAFFDERRFVATCLSGGAVGARADQDLRRDRGPACPVRPGSADATSRALEPEITVSK